MQTLELMRRRIQNAEDLHAVVRVMKALAAVSIRQYEKAVESLAEYHRTIECGLHVALRNRIEDVVAEEPRIDDRWGIIVFGSDQGMCGSFNEQVAAYALEQMNELRGTQENQFVLAVGSRVVSRLEDAGCLVHERYPVPNAVSGINSVVDDLLVKIEFLRFQEGIEQFLLIHHRPQLRGVTQPGKLQLLPVNRPWLTSLGEMNWPSRSLPTFTVDWRLLFSSLIRQHLLVSLYRAIAESLASENASRLASMQAAEKNIQDHLASLTTVYHQERQQSITEELFDILAGFEAHTGDEDRDGKSDR